MDRKKDTASSPSYPSDWRVERWQRQEYDRLYIRSGDGVPVGWFDLISGVVSAVEPRRLGELLDFLADWRSTPEAAHIDRLPRPEPLPIRRESVRPARRGGHEPVVHEHGEQAPARERGRALFGRRSRRRARTGTDTDRH
ncbi:hypothetical protein [Nigerium massiliense]|uniref:hypothetical protein n=1 Tax=Nigerium massiliense TaxID=1522317 RepID=UPI00058D730F|nr:hypothetical protein [Nigerium massiliense]